MNLADIDPIYYERTYMLEPEGVGVKPYYLLKQGLENANRVAVARIALRNKEQPKAGEAAQGEKKRRRSRRKAA